MSEKSRLQRTRKEIIHSIKTQQQDFEVFQARDDTLPPLRDFAVPAWVAAMG
jgi:hypothetical protein